MMDEVAFAPDEKKTVIPVLHRDCKIPLRLRRLQYIDARAEYDRVLDALIRMLASREEGEETLRSTTPLNGDPVVRASAAERPIIEKTNQERLFHAMRSSRSAWLAI